MNKVSLLSLFFSFFFTATSGAFAQDRSTCEPPKAEVAPAISSSFNELYGYLPAPSPSPTPLVHDQGMLELTGNAPAGSEINAIVILSPDNNVNKKVIDEDGITTYPDCVFPEDEWSMNNNNKIETIKATQDDSGKYSLKIPVHGLRGKCVYATSEVFFDLKKNTVFATLTLNPPEPKSSPTPTPTPDPDGLNYTYDDSMADLSSQKTIQCDFASTDLGLCNDKSYYAVPFQAGSVSLDFVQKPQDDTQY